MNNIVCSFKLFLFVERSAPDDNFYVVRAHVLIPKMKNEVVLYCECKLPQKMQKCELLQYSGISLFCALSAVMQRFCKKKSIVRTLDATHTNKRTTDASAEHTQIVFLAHSKIVSQAIS